MKTWYNTPERIDALEKAAREWVGTPFVANSRIQGPHGGTCCHMLAEQLYIAAGYPLGFDVPAGSMRWSSVSTVSLIAQFFDERPDIFQRVDLAAIEMMPGDVIGFRIGGCVHHVGVVLRGGKFVHCMRGLGTKIFNLNDPTYARRIDIIWRPKP